MTFERTDRIGEEIRRELDHIIREQLRDPRIEGTYSITRVDVTRDLRYAKVWVSVLEEDKRAQLIKALRTASGFMRRALGQALTLRYTPELLIELDTNIEYGVRIASLLKQVLPQEERPDDEGT